MGLFVSLPLFFVLSVGPAAMIHEKCGPTGRKVIETVYSPLERAVRPFKPLRNVIGAYVDLWV